MHRLLLAHGTYMGEASFQGRLFAAGGFAAAIRSSDSNDRLHGEIYLLKEPASAVLLRLDEYEGCGPAEAKPLFVREAARVICSGGEVVNAWIYLYARSTGSLRQIVSGRWQDGVRG